MADYSCTTCGNVFSVPDWLDSKIRCPKCGKDAQPKEAASKPTLAPSARVEKKSDKVPDKAPDKAPDQSMKKKMIYATAVIACVTELIIYSAIGVFLGWESPRDGGTLQGVIFFSVIVATWVSITKRAESIGPVAARNLVGIKGWLAVFCISLIVINPLLMLLWFAQEQDVMEIWSIVVDGESFQAAAT